MIAIPKCPDYSTYCQTAMVTFRLDAVSCPDGTNCYLNPLPTCCQSLNLNAMVARCGGDTNCLNYYMNSNLLTATTPDTLSVDSLINMFALGMQGGFLTYLPLFAMSCMILVVILLLNYAISKT